MSKKLFKKEDLPPILEWEDAESEFAAEQVSKNLRLGRTYFAYNLPLQIHIIYKDVLLDTGGSTASSCNLNGHYVEVKWRKGKIRAVPAVKQIALVVISVSVA